MTQCDHHRDRRSTTMACVALATLLVACGGAEPKEPQSEEACGARGQTLEDLELVGTNGSHLALVEVSPSPPVVGNTTWLVELRNTSGDLLKGASALIEVSPRMPDHAHGSPTSVRIEETDDGQYQFSPVNIFMPGYWEISVRLTTTGAEDEFILGLCVD